MRYLKPATKTVSQLAFVPGTTLLLSLGGGQQTIAVYDTLASRSTAFLRLKPEAGAFWGFSVSPDGRWLVALDHALTFHAWETERLDAPAVTAALPSDEQRYPAGRFQSQLPPSVWDADGTWRVLLPVYSASEETPFDLGRILIVPFRFDPDSGSLAPAPGELLPPAPWSWRAFPGGDCFLISSVSLDGARLEFVVRAGQSEESRSVVREVEQYQLTEYIYHAGISPSGMLIAVRFGFGLYVGPPEMSRGALLAEGRVDDFQDFGAGPTFVTDQHVLAAGKRGLVFLLEVDPFREAERWQWDVGSVTALAASADGTLFAAAGGRLVIWDRE